MAKWNELLDMLILEIHEDYRDVAMFAAMLRACPDCREKRADAIEELDAAAGMLVDAMARLRGLKKDGETADEDKGGD